MSINVYGVSGLYPLQHAVIGSYVKMLVCEVLSDRYRIRQGQFQYQAIEILMTFRVYSLYTSH